MPLGSAWCRSPGRPPQTPSGASDQTPISANSSTIASSSVSMRAKREQHGGDRIADVGRGDVGGDLRRQRRRGLGQREHAERERRRDGQRQRPRRPHACRRRGRSARAARFGAAQPRRGADQQRAGQAAADRRFGQRHVDAVQLHPDQRQQQAVGDEAGDGGEGVARDDGPQPPARRSAAPTTDVERPSIMRAGPGAARARAISCDARGAGQQHEQPDAAPA